MRGRKKMPTEKQNELKAAIEGRGSNITAKWTGNRLDVLMTGRKANGGRYPIRCSATFDDPAAVYGVVVLPPDRHPISRIVFYESLRVGNPDSLPDFVAGCNQLEVWDGAPDAGKAR
jgi:hypothetical protein